MSAHRAAWSKNEPAVRCHDLDSGAARLLDFGSSARIQQASVDWAEKHVAPPMFFGDAQIRLMIDLQHLRAGGNEIVNNGNRVATDMIVKDDTLRLGSTIRFSCNQGYWR